MNIIRAAEKLATYVNYGVLDRPDQFDKSFEEVAINLPSHLQKAPARVWRAMILEPRQAQALEAGRSITLEERNFSSWTSCHVAAQRYLRTRILKTISNSVGIIISKNTTDEICIANVREVYRATMWDNPDVQEWDRFVNWERECIFRNSTNLLTVNPEDIWHLQQASASMCFSNRNAAGVMRPYCGEFVWDDAGDTGFEIDGILDMQPAIQNGFWSVIGDDGRTHNICLDGDEWTTVESLTYEATA